MTSPLRIYLVEDNAIVRDALLDIISDLLTAQVVGWAETEAEATRWLATHCCGWDAAVVDMFLKSGSGLGLLRANPRRQSGQRLVVLSNYATPEIRRQCFAAGADAVFDKSNEIEEFTEFLAGIDIGEGPQAEAHSTR